MGGLNPLYVAFSQACIPPPQRGQTLRDPGLVAFGKPRRANPEGVFPGVVPPQMAPLVLGLLGFCWEYLLVAIVPSFTDVSDFLGRFIPSHR